MKVGALTLSGKRTKQGLKEEGQALKVSSGGSGWRKNRPGWGRGGGSLPRQCAALGSVGGWLGAGHGVLIPGRGGHSGPGQDARPPGFLGWDVLICEQLLLSSQVSCEASARLWEGSNQTPF